MTRGSARIYHLASLALVLLATVVGVVSLGGKAEASMPAEVDVSFSKSAERISALDEDAEVVIVPEVSVQGHLTDATFELDLAEGLVVSGDVSVNAPLELSPEVGDGKVSLALPELEDTKFSLNVPVKLASVKDPALVSVASVTAKEMSSASVGRHVISVDDAKALMRASQGGSEEQVGKSISVATATVSSVPTAAKLEDSAKVKVTQEGDSAYWTVRVKNTSDETLDSITISDVFDPDLEVVEFSFPTDQEEALTAPIPQVGNNVSLTISNLQAGKSVAATALCRVKTAKNDGGLEASATVKAKDDTLSASHTVGITRPTLQMSEFSVKPASGSGKVKPGDTANVHIKVENIAADSHADELEVISTLPEGVSVVGEPVVSEGYTADASAQTTVKIKANDQTKLLGNEGALEADFSVKVPEKATGSLTIQTTANAHYAIGDAGEADLLVGDAKLTFEKKASVENAAVGDTVTYTLTAANTGGEDVRGVTITDELPEGLEFVPTEDLNIDGRTLREEIGTLASGKKVTITVDALVMADKAELTNTARLEATGIQPIVRSATIKVVDPKLSLNKIADKDMIAPGDRINYTVTLSNGTGLPTAKGIVVTDTLPPELTLVDNVVVNQKGAKTTVDGNTLTVTLNELKGGQFLTIVYPAVVGNDVTDEFTNKVTAKVDNMDDISSEKPVSGMEPGLNLEHQSDAKLVQPGDTVSGKVTIGNGSESATLRGAKVSLTIPKGYRFTSLERGEGVDSYDRDDAGNVVVSFENLAPKATSEFTYSLLVEDEANGKAEVSASATADGAEGVSKSINFEAAYPSATFSQAASSKEASVGSIIDFTVSLENSGPVPLKEVRVSDTLPEALELVSEPAPDGGTTFVVEKGDNAWVATTDEMALGEKTSFVFSAKLVSASDASVTNDCTFSARGLSNAPSSASINVLRPKLNMTLSVDNKLVVTGSTPAFTFILENPTQAPISGVKVSSSLPKGMSLAEEPEVDKADYGFDSTSSSGSNWAMEGGTIPSGEKATFTFAGKLDSLPDGADGLEVPVSVEADGVPLTTATVSLVTNNQQLANNSVLSSLGISKVASNNSPAAGSIVNYTITVTNPATSSSTGAFTVQDVLPEDLSWNGAISVTSGSASQSVQPPVGKTFSYTVEDLPQGSSVSITYGAKVDPGTQSGTVLKNVASVVSGSTVQTSATASVTVRDATTQVANKLQDTGIPALGFGFGCAGALSLALWFVRRRDV